MSPGSPTLQIRLLGELAIHREGAELRLPRSKKTRALLGYLILSGRPQRRGRLCSLLWDVADDPRAALRWSLSKLRPLVNATGATRIVTSGDTVAFDAAGAHVDVVAARAALSHGVDDLDTERLLEIAGSFRGELLEGLDMSDFDDFQAWCVAAREEVRGLHARVLRALIDRLGDRPDDALPHARKLVEIEPVDELVRARLVELLVAAGRPSEARQQCEAGERQLRELGTHPTGALEQALRAVDADTRAPREPAVEINTEAEPLLDADTPLVGRHAERARLATVLEQVNEHGREHVMIISGEPGVGKTRLLVELLDDVRRAEGAVLEGRAFEAERGRPFGPWIDAFRHVTSMRDDDHLAPLLSGHAPAASASSREQMFTAAAELIAAQAERSGLVALAIDDVQWIDEASAELLHFVARTLRGAPVLIALTARDGEIVDNEPMQRVLRSLRRERMVDELDVGPLTRGDTEALIKAVSPRVDGSRVFEQCGGNALFALELARSGPANEADVPPTLTDVVRARVDRLPPSAADLLRWAAVFGPTAPIDRLAAVSSLSGEALMTSLEVLERHGLVRADGDAYKMSHDVVRHVVYSELSQPRRRLMHQQIAAHLHAEGADDEASAADIAHHANLAGDAAMAARACVAAGRRSLKLFAKHDALALARRGARYAATLPEPDRTELSLELWEVRLSAETPAARDEVVQELETLCEHALDLGALAHARIGFHLLSYLRWDVGHNVDASRHALHAEQLTRGVDGPQRIDALSEAARCLLKLDRELGRAEALVLEARAVATRLGIERPLLADAVGLLRGHQGALDEAAERFCDAQRLARQEQDRLGEFQSLEHMMMLELHRGNLDEAVRLTSRLLSLGSKLREGSEGCTARALAAVTAVAKGEDDARPRLEAALTELREVDAKQRLSFALLAAAGFLLDAGDPATARAYAEEALELVVLLRLRSDIAWARSVIARAAGALGDTAARDAQIDALRAADHQGVAEYALRASQDVLEID